MAPNSSFYKKLLSICWPYFLVFFAYKKDPQLGKNATKHASYLTQFFLTSLDYIAIHSPHPPLHTHPLLPKPTQLNFGLWRGYWQMVQKLLQGTTYSIGEKGHFSLVLDTTTLQFKVIDAKQLLLLLLLFSWHLLSTQNTL